MKKYWGDNQQYQLMPFSFSITLKKAFFRSNFICQIVWKIPKKALSGANSIFRPKTRIKYKDCDKFEPYLVYYSPVNHF